MYPSTKQQRVAAEILEIIYESSYAMGRNKAMKALRVQLHLSRSIAIKPGCQVLYGISLTCLLARIFFVIAKADVLKELKH